MHSNNEQTCGLWAGYRDDRCRNKFKYDGHCAAESLNRCFQYSVYEYILRLFIKQIHENKFRFVQSTFGINFFVDDKIFSYIENRNKQTFPFKAKTTYMVQVKTFDKNY